MAVVIVLAVVLGVAVSGYVGVRLVDRRRTPRELRGDWWPEFEREFRAHSSKVAASQQKDRGRRADRGPSSR